MTGTFRTLNAAEPDLADHYATGDRLTPAGLFQIVSDEVHKDGTVDSWEGRILSHLAAQLALDPLTMRDLMALSSRKHKAGRLGTSRRLDPKVAYCKVLYFVHHSGADPDACAELALLRTLFGFSLEDHRVLHEFVKAKL